MRVGWVFVLLSAVICNTVAFGGDINLRHGFDFGGETLARLYYQGGGSDSLRAGDGEHTELGYEFQTPLLGNKHLTTELAFGYKYDLLYASNFEAELDRWTATLVQYYKKTNPRVGFGVTRHFRTEYKHSGDRVSRWESKINISHGVVFLVDYHFRSPWNLGAKVVRMKYTDLGTSFDANSVGLFVGYSF